MTLVWFAIKKYSPRAIMQPWGVPVLCWVTRGHQAATHVEGAAHPLFRVSSSDQYTRTQTKKKNDAKPCKYKLTIDRQRHRAGGLERAPMVEYQNKTIISTLSPGGRMERSAGGWQGCVVGVGRVEYLNWWTIHP